MNFFIGVISLGLITWAGTQLGPLGWIFATIVWLEIGKEVMRHWRASQTPAFQNVRPMDEDQVNAMLAVREPIFIIGRHDVAMRFARDYPLPASHIYVYSEDGIDRVQDEGCKIVLVDGWAQVEGWSRLQKNLMDGYWREVYPTDDDWPKHVKT